MAESAKKTYPAVDIWKFCCAILVIAIHAKPFVNNFWLDAGVGIATRIAVPYFFISSGYFLFSKLDRTPKERKNSVYGHYFLRILKMYTVWYVIHTVLRTAYGSLEPRSLLSYIRNYFIPMDGSILWFLNALLWGTLIVYLLNRVLNRKVIFVISAVTLVIGYSFTTVYSPLEGVAAFAKVRNLVYSRIGVQNGLFFAFPYLALGALMSQSAPLKPRPRTDCIGAVLCVCLLAAESLAAVLVFHAPLTFLWLSALPMTYFVFRFTLTTDLGANVPTHMIRRMSTGMYVIHRLILDGLEALVAVAGLSDPQNLLLFGSTVVLTVLISYALVKLSAVKGFGFLKIMI